MQHRKLSRRISFITVAHVSLLPVSSFRGDTMVCSPSCSKSVYLLTLQHLKIDPALLNIFLPPYQRLPHIMPCCVSWKTL
ncbi:hypothetical protein EDD85DRAFT_851358 [Armillaria nabsnona]|nr:hypothetical protein EDD85DRAFT_851358 [Armillaria nabsnona]